MIKEKHLQEFIYQNYIANTLSTYGLTLSSGVMYSELDLASYGRLDLAVFYFTEDYSYIRDEMINTAEVTILEIKKNELTLESLSQICRYSLAIQNSYTYLGNQVLDFSNDFEELTMRRILVGKSVHVDLVNILQCFSKVEVYLYKEFNGVIYFNKYDRTSAHLYTKNKINLNIL